MEAARLEARLASFGDAEDLERALRLLETATSNSSEDPAILNDLAATRLALAAVRESPIGLHRAYEILARARELAPSIPEIAFNRALALERMLLWPAAAQAWEESLPLIRSEGFLREAERRAEDCRHRTSTLPDASGPGVELTSLEAQRRVRAGLHGWAAATRAGRKADAARALAQSREAAEVLAERFRDRSFLDSATLARGVESPEHPLVEAHFLLGDSSQALDAACGHPESPLVQARGLFSSSGSPFELAAGLELGECRYFRADYKGARAELEPVRQRARRESYPLLAARSSWLLGTNGYHEGTIEDTYRHYEDALEYYERAGDREHAAFLNVLLAKSSSTMGLEEQAWLRRLAALENRGSITRRDRWFTLFQDAANALEAQGFLHTALAFRDAQVDVSATDESRDSDLEPFSRVERARTYHRLGDAARTGEELEQAAALLELMPPTHGNRARVEAKLDSLRAEVWSRDRNRDALAAAARALEHFEGSARTGSDRLNVLRLHTLAGIIHQDGGDPEAARQSFTRSLDTADSLRTTIRDPKLKVRFLEQHAELADRLVALELDLGDPPAALLTLDRTVNRLVLDREIADFEHPAEQGRLDRTRLDSRTAVLVLHALPNRLGRWVVTRQGVRYSEVPVGRSDLLGRLRAQRPEDDLRSLVIPTDTEPFETLALLPVGPLSSYSFSSLRDSGTDRRLIEDHRLVRIANLSALWRQPPTGLTEMSRDAVVLVGSVEDGASLPAVAAEIDALRAIYGELTVAGRADIPRTLESRRPSVLHFAGHASVDPSDPFRARLGEDDGLSFLDILRTPAMVGSTVMLAACDTATRGLLDSGEDASLATAFLAAGARYVVASLAPVVDRETAELAIDFHRALAAGIPAIDALRGAQLRNLSEGGNTWSEFVLIASDFGPGR